MSYTPSGLLVLANAFSLTEINASVQRLERDSKASDQLAANQLSMDQQSANALDFDLDGLRQQLHIARANLIVCSEKLESEFISERAWLSLQTTVY